MAWWNKLVGRAPSDLPSKLSFPVHIELVPGSLTAHVYHHEVTTPDESLPCWSFVTEGLVAHQQKEVIFTLCRNRNEAAHEFPQDPLHLFRTIYQLAQQGQRVDVGGVTQFGSRNLFGRHLTYIHPQPFPEVTLPSPAVAAFLVTHDEVLAVQEFGITRVMARLGQASRYYPCPPWSDRSRLGLSFASTRQESILTKVPRARVPGVRVCQDGGQVRVRLARRPEGAWQQFFAETRGNAPLVLLTDLDPGASGCLVWEPGQSGPSAITPPSSDGSCLSGCFVLLVPEQSADRGQLLEDGFALLLTNESWAALRQAMIQGQALTVPATEEGMPLSLEWWEESYDNPVDQKTYVASGGWQTYQPQPSGEGDREGKKVKTESLRLLTAQEDIAARTTVQDLATFCKDVERIADQNLGSCDRGFKLLVQFKCTPSGHEIQLAHQGDGSHELLQAFHDALKGMKPLTVHQDEVAFQFEMDVQP